MTRSNNSRRGTYGAEDQPPLPMTSCTAILASVEQVRASVEQVRASVEQVRAAVRGVIVSPRPTVILDTDDGRIQASTTAQWMDAAWARKDRSDLVATIVTNSSGVRLLAIRTADEQAARDILPSVDETLDRFDGVLRAIVAKESNR